MPTDSPTGLAGYCFSFSVLHALIVPKCIVIVKNIIVHIPLTKSPNSLASVTVAKCIHQTQLMIQNCDDCLKEN